MNCCLRLRTRNKFAYRYFNSVAAIDPLTATSIFRIKATTSLQQGDLLYRRHHHENHRGPSTLISTAHSNLEEFAKCTAEARLTHGGMKQMMKNETNLEQQHQVLRTKFRYDYYSRIVEPPPTPLRSNCSDIASIPDLGRNRNYLHVRRKEEQGKLVHSERGSPDGWPHRWYVNFLS